MQGRRLCISASADARDFRAPGIDSTDIYTGGTTLSTRTTRSSKRAVAALAAFGVVASTFAIGSPVSADLFDIPGAGGIRLVPDTSDPDFGLDPDRGNQNQPAPVIQAGVDGQPVASSQIMIHNQWESGDRVLVQLFDSAGLNCTSVPNSIGYSKVPTVPKPTVTVSGPFDFDGTTTPWENNNGDPDVGFGADAPTPGAATTAPTFNVNLLSSTGCDPNDITDVLEIELNNESSASSTDAWVFTINGVVLDVGATVTGGPVQQVPFGQNASDGINAYENTADLFSGNLSALQSGVPQVVNEWTNPAFVAPISLSSDFDGTLVGDGFAQNLGSVTLSETQGDAFDDLNFFGVCFGPGINDIREPLLTRTTIGATVPLASVQVYTDVDFNECIRFEITAQTAGIDSVTIDGIFGNVNFAGSKIVSLNFVPGGFTDQYLTPDDQFNLDAGQDGVGDYTDVNLGTLETFVTPLGSASALSDRIGGNDRFETAAKIAYSTVECADFAVLVNGNSFPDSLSASYLAGALTLTDFNDEDEVPILTTSGTSLHPAAELAIRELGVRTVYIVGGPAAVSADVAAAVDALPRTRCGGDISNNTQTVQVDRIQGADRYVTNQQVIQRAQSILDSEDVNYNERIRYQANAGEASERTVLMASGSDFADAMSAGPISFGDDDYGFPLVLTTPNTLSPVAALTLTNLDIDRVIIVGGEAAVSAGVVASLEALDIDVIRLAGANRYETAIQVLLWAATPEFPNLNPVLVGGEGFNLGLGWPISGDVVLARGDSFADALAVAPYVAASPKDLLVLTTPTSLHPAAGAFITTLVSLGFTPDIIAIGLGAAISGNVLDEANALANP